MAFLPDGSYEAYRIANARFNILNGGGAAKFGARWNSPGHFVVYAALSYAGALLEKLVHTNIGTVPADQVWATIHIPADVVIQQIALEDLPNNWISDESITRQVGDDWYSEGRTAVLIVPSAIAPEVEENLLINQTHSDFAKISATTPQPVRWDGRFFAR